MKVLLALAAMLLVASCGNLVGTQEVEATGPTVLLRFDYIGSGSSTEQTVTIQWRGQTLFVLTATTSSQQFSETLDAEIGINSLTISVTEGVTISNANVSQLEPCPAPEDPPGGQTRLLTKKDKEDKKEKKSEKSDKSDKSDKSKKSGKSESSSSESVSTVSSVSSVSSASTVSSKSSNSDISESSSSTSAPPSESEEPETEEPVTEEPETEEPEEPVYYNVEVINTPSELNVQLEVTLSDAGCLVSVDQKEVEEPPAPFTLSFQTAKLAFPGSQLGVQEITVLIDGVSVASINPVGLSYQTQQIDLGVLSQGQHELTFQTDSRNRLDHPIFYIENVELTNGQQSVILNGGFQEQQLGYQGPILHQQRVKYWTTEGAILYKQYAASNFRAEYSFQNGYSLNRLSQTFTVQ